jgi:hypothetical protein
MRAVLMSGDYRSRKNGASTTEGGSGLSSKDDRGLVPLPARSNGLDNVDGGPDAAFYIQIGIIKQVSIGGRF